MNSSCLLRNGRPKKCYKTFDDAHDAATRNSGEHYGRRMHAYRCDEHGWHVGHNVMRSSPEYGLA